MANKRTTKWTHDDLMYAMENAAEFLETEEWPDDDGGAQVAANHEAAKRIRAMAKRLDRRGQKQVLSNAEIKNDLGC